MKTTKPKLNWFPLPEFFQELRECLNGDLDQLWEGKIETIAQFYQWLESTRQNPDFIHQQIAEKLGIQWRSSLADQSPSAEFIKKYPIGLARTKGVIGLQIQDDEDSLSVALSSLNSLVHLDTLRRFLKRPVDVFFAPASQVSAAINSAYQQRDSQTIETIDNLDTKEVIEAIQRTDLLDSTDRSPVIKLVNSILFDAVKERASDIHLQPFEEHLQVRFRIDGVLFNQFKIPKSTQEEVLSRVKVLGEMDIAEKRLPQDGRASVQIGDRLVDLRIASLPSSFGERIVIRLLDKSARLYSLSELGMPGSIFDPFQKMIHLEHGLVLVTGPTGSGKSTTLYASLQEIQTEDRNVVTLEDPIEYQLQGISQVQVNEKKGMTFAKGLRNVLRQDPDIIMVGEIRDKETADMAIQSALTGHMVFSTLHTNDAASAVSRLLDLGVEPYLVASSLVGVLAQRLVRRICPDCKVKQPDADTQMMKIPGDTSGIIPNQGNGCKNCRETGYQGRLGLFEFMPISDVIRSLIQTRENASKIKSTAKQDGMQFLSDDGIEKIRAGQTTVEEVVRVSMEG